MKMLFLLIIPFFVFQVVSAGVNDGLIGYWPLNGDAKDYSGNGYDGELLTGASFIDNPSGDGKVLQTQLGGVNFGHVRVGLPASVHPGANVADFQSSGALWVWFDDRLPLEHASGWQGILGHPPGILYVDRNLGTNKVWSMMKHGNLSGSNTWPKSDANAVDQEGIWYHIAWTLISHEAGGTGHFRWYVDGVLASSEHDYGVLTYQTSTFRIGTDYTGRATNTKIAEVRLYDRVLTTDEIATLASTDFGTPALTVDGGLEVTGSIYAQGAVTLGDFDSIVDELLNTQQGVIRFNGTNFEGYDGAKWKSFTSGSAHKLTTPNENTDVIVVDSSGHATVHGTMSFTAPMGDISMGVYDGE